MNQGGEIDGQGARMMVKLTPYPASITASGKYMKVYFGDFPMTQILNAPDGWDFLKVSQWRRDCPDECWRIVYRRRALSETQATP